VVGVGSDRLRETSAKDTSDSKFRPGNPLSKAHRQLSQHIMDNLHNRVNAADDPDDDAPPPAPAAALPAPPAEVNIAGIWLPDPSPADYLFIVNLPVPPE
jgi:hypothetical protein